MPLYYLYAVMSTACIELFPFTCPFAPFRLPDELLNMVLVDLVQNHSSSFLVCRRWRDPTHHHHLRVTAKNYQDVPRFLAEHPSCHSRELSVKVLRPLLPKLRTHEFFISLSA